MVLTCHVDSSESDIMRSCTAVFRGIMWCPNASLSFLQRTVKCYNHCSSQTRKPFSPSLCPIAYRDSWSPADCRGPCLPEDPVAYFKIYSCDPIKLPLTRVFRLLSNRVLIVGYITISGYGMYRSRISAVSLASVEDKCRQQRQGHGAFE